MLRYLLNFCFPNFCCNCSAFLSVREVALCEACASGCRAVANPCWLCGGDVEDGQACGCASNVVPRYLSRNIACYSYEGLVRKVIHEIKFSRRFSFVRFFVPALSRALSALNLFELDPVFVPVPISRQRLRERGFNQSEVIVRYVSSMVRARCLCNALRKTKNNAPQSLVSFAERLVNPAGLYVVKSPALIVGRNVVLFDDVFTTGATMNECARVLLEAGALAVFSVTLAVRMLSATVSD